MAIYTNIRASDLKKITTPYGVEVKEFDPIDGGNANSSYHLKAKMEEYILTIAEESTLLEMKRLATLLQWLKEHGFATSEVRTTHNEELVTQFSGKPVLIKNWISGKVHENISLEMLEQIGRSLANLHQIPAPEYLPRSQSYGLQSFPSVINKGIDLKYENWLKSQFNYFKGNIPENLPKGLIHGDLFFDNVLFENGELKAIIDFEEACYYYFIFDLGMSVVGLCRTDGEIDLLKIKALIKGYEQIRFLSSLEKESLPIFIEYAAAATSNWRFCKYNILSPSPEFQDKHWEMVSVAEEIHAIPKGHFNSSVFM